MTDGDEVLLFQSVMARFIETFSGHFFLAFRQFETQAENSDEGEVTKSIFELFPRKIRAYQKIIENLSELAICNPSRVIAHLVELFDNALTHKEMTVFTEIYSFSPSMYVRSSHHNLVEVNFALIFLSDLLQKIVFKYGTTIQGIVISKCAIQLCKPEFKKKFILPTVFETWAHILSYISQTSFNDIVSLIKPYLAQPNPRPYKLISYLRVDCAPDVSTRFMEDIFNYMRAFHKRGILNSQIFSSVSSMLLYSSFQCDVLQKYFDLAWSVREDSTYKEGAFDMIVTLFLLMPRKESRIDRFFKKHVFAHVADDLKVERSLKMFRKLLACEQTDPADMLSPYRRKISRGYELSMTFMANFFPKSNFAACPSVFRDTLVRLALLDENYFIQEMLPKFVQLNPSDPRFVVLLKMIPCLNNSKDFGSKVALNTIVRGRICQNLQILCHKGDDYVSLEEIIDRVKRQVIENNAKIAHFLEHAELYQIGELHLLFRASENLGDNYTPLPAILKALPFILEDDDYLQQGAMKRIIRLCHVQSQVTSTAAMNVARRICSRPRLQLAMIDALLDILGTNRQKEVVLVCLTLLYEIVEQQPPQLPVHTLYDIELAAALGLASTQPVTRIIAYSTLQVVDKMLGGRGAFSTVKGCQGQAERCVKTRLVRKFARGEKTTVPRETLYLHWVLAGHYYDIWLMFLTEFLEIMIAFNYTPLLQRFNDSLAGFIGAVKAGEAPDSPDNIAIVLMFLTSHIRRKTYLKGRQVYQVELFEPIGVAVDVEEDDLTAFFLFKYLFESNNPWKDRLVFSVIEHLNYSLATSVSSFLCLVPADQLSDAAAALVVLLSSPGNTDEATMDAVPQIVEFLSVVQSNILTENVNSPRRIEWTEETEHNVVRHAELCVSYCLLLERLISHPVSEEEWSVSGREVVMCFLLNWISTTSPILERLRRRAESALITLVHAGRMFADSLVFDQEIARMMVELEKRHGHVLGSFVFYHMEYILGVCCEACLLAPRVNADILFDNLLVVFTGGKPVQLYEHVGGLLAVGLTFKKLGHRRADAFLMAFQGSIGHIPEAEASQGPFGYAIEMIYAFCFRLLKVANAHTPVKEMIDAIRPLIYEVRLLPKQTFCVAGTPQQMVMFTPYRFLVELMMATEAVTDDGFTSVGLLWLSLLQAPDHAEIVPLFIMNWENESTKKKLLMYLITNDAPFLFDMLIERCSFAYYYHVTSQGGDFEKELWVADLLTAVFERRTDLLFNKIARIIHFAILFYRQSEGLLNLIMRQLSISIPPSFHNEGLLDLAMQALESIREVNPDCPEEWGREALKWLFGSCSLKYATISMIIFNFILRPIDDIVINGVIKSVLYFISDGIEEGECDRLVSESFKFFSSIFTGHEQLSMRYARAFLDCPSFSDECLSESVDIFLKSINFGNTRQAAWSSVISVVRSMLPFLETNERYQQILGLLLKLNLSAELPLIAAPLHESSGAFPELEGARLLIERASETSLCKAIEHYSVMVGTASSGLSNAIFWIAGEATEKAHDDNIRAPMHKLYQAALAAIDRCPEAMAFLRAVAERCPRAAGAGDAEYAGWRRGIESVIGELRRMVPEEESVVTITDCGSLKAVYSFLGSDFTPRILPFAAQKELMEGMGRVAGTPRRRAFSIRRAFVPPSPRQQGIMSSMSPPPPPLLGVPIEAAAEQFGWELRELKAPLELLGDLPLFDSKESLLMTDEEFCKAEQ